MVVKGSNFQLQEGKFWGPDVQHGDDSEQSWAVTLKSL